tara:strand:- start:6408 stop:7346 length:939 start_codon:yes stop_codon:yes gene_type:complete
MVFTIAIPAYKEIYLEKCINSVVSQSFKNFELIILNDCSPENIKGVVNKFKDSRIRYFENSENVGALNVVDNWNKCSDLSIGDYISIIGDDDILEIDYLEKFYNEIKKYKEKNVFHCRSWIINEYDKKIDITPSLPESEKVFEYIWHRLTGKRIQFIGDFVFKTNHLKKIGGFSKLPLAWYSDDLTSYIASIGNGIQNINKPLFNYRINQFSITSTGNYFHKLEANTLFFYTLVDKLLILKPVGEKEKIYHNKLSKSLKNLKRKKEFEIIDSLDLSQIKIFDFFTSKRSIVRGYSVLMIVSILKKLAKKIVK